MSEDLRKRSPLHIRMRRRLGAFVVDGAFRGMANAGRIMPHARPERHHVEIIRDVQYASHSGPLAEHRLDIYRPTRHSGPYPVMLYVHGGGFRILSKDTHWLMGLAFARRGYLVFNISYRLAPMHPYPAALEDTASAFLWVCEQAERYGGDLGRLAFAGESAGANLVTSLAIMCAYERPERFAEEVFKAKRVPRAVIAQCGLYQVSDTHRYLRRKRISPWIFDRIEEVERAYLKRALHQAPGGIELADPLVVLEKSARNEGLKPARPLPAFFASVGTKDPLLDDTRRLKVALDDLGVECDARYYEGEAHAFQAMLWRKNARRCWLSTYRFLDAHMGGPTLATVTPKEGSLDRVVDSA